MRAVGDRSPLGFACTSSDKLKGDREFFFIVTRRKGGVPGGGGGGGITNVTEMLTLCDVAVSYT